MDIVKQLGPAYRFSRRDFEHAWDTMARHFGSKGNVRETEFELADLYLRDGDIQRRTKIWLTLAEGLEAMATEQAEAAARRRA
jgi:hypothetical protein